MSRICSKFCVPLTIVTAFISACQKPPDASLQQARQAINGAAQAGAAIYAKEQFYGAERLLEAGWMEMARQNGRLPLFRRYGKADSLLALAEKTAVEATNLAVQAKSRLDSTCRSQIEEFTAALSSWRTSLDNSLLIYDAERYWSMAELGLRTATLLVADSLYDEAQVELAKVKNWLDAVSEAIADQLNDQAMNATLWRRWLAETLAESKRSQAYAVVVDKSAHKVYLVKDGIVQKSFRCELGYNPATQKLFAGDGATPEGQYVVTEVKRNSRYHRALMLNYPNEQDRRRFAINKKRGIISRRAAIGGLIEIHGHGGRGSDWTNGCIALTDKDIEELLQYVGVGTPVTIVRTIDRWP